jgi:hypothetical protein
MGELTTDSAQGGSAARTIRTLRRHNLVVKVLGRGRRTWRMHEADRR